MNDICILREIQPKWNNVLIKTAQCIGKQNVNVNTSQIKRG